MDVQALVDGVLEKAHWLRRNTRKAIAERFAEDHFVRELAGHSDAHHRAWVRKLLYVLCCIPAAEQEQDDRGYWHTKLFSFIADKTPGISSGSTGSWQLNEKNASYFGKKTGLFKKTLKEDRKGVHFVIEHICKYIGIDKTPQQIFLEYNRGVNATVIAAVQYVLQGLNREFRLGLPNIEPDGWWGRGTRNALMQVLEETKNRVTMEEHELQELAALVERLKEEEQQEEKHNNGNKAVIDQAYKTLSEHYEVPLPSKEGILENKHLYEERHWTLFIKELFTQVRSIGQLKKALRHLGNCVNVPQYVKVAMHHYNILEDQG